MLDNAREHIFDGIVVKTEKGNRFVDAPEVARITERRVTLTINAVEAAELQPPIQRGPAPLVAASGASPRGPAAARRA